MTDMELPVMLGVEAEVLTHLLRLPGAARLFAAPGSLKMKISSDGADTRRDLWYDSDGRLWITAVGTRMQRRRLPLG